MTRVMCSGKPVYNRRGYKGLWTCYNKNSGKIPAVPGHPAYDDYGTSVLILKPKGRGFQVVDFYDSPKVTSSSVCEARTTSKNRKGFKGWKTCIAKKTGRVVRIVTPRTKAMLDA